MSRVMYALTAVVALLWACSPVAAQTNCAPHAVVEQNLTENYGEQLASAGVANANAVLQVWTNPDTGTWTVVVLRADGTACVPASGENWLQYEPAGFLLDDPA